MATFRKIHVSFWSDAFVSELNDKSKLFYLYLMTNERTTQLGAYEITKKQMAYDLGYSIETISKLILEIQKSGRIMYNDQTSEIALKNWNRYNFNPSSKVKSLVDKEIARIKDKGLIEYLYSTDTVSIHNPQEEEEQEEEEKKNNIGDRKLKFASSLEPFLSMYGRPMLKEFYEYWTEPNKSQTKFRQELEKTWSLERRLETWAKNDKNIKPSGEQQTAIFTPKTETYSR